MASPSVHLNDEDTSAVVGFDVTPTKILDSCVDSMLDGFVGMLVIPWSLALKQVSTGPLAPLIASKTEIFELHQEVQFCLWAMNVSLSVYMKLLNLVDIKVRKEISNVVSRFLSEWKGVRDSNLSDALDQLIILEFNKYAITDIPDMERLQRDKDCQVLSSTIACYIKDIAVKLDTIRENDVGSTIEIIFPPTKDFIGRCFFSRLASVSARLLDLITCSLVLENSGDSSSRSTDTTRSTTVSSPVYE
jgi:hypothetical protein